MALTAGEHSDKLSWYGRHTESPDNRFGSQIPTCWDTLYEMRLLGLRGCGLFLSAGLYVGAGYAQEKHYRYDFGDPKSPPTDGYQNGDGKLEIFYASGTLLDARTGKPYFTRLPDLDNGQWLRILKVRDGLPGMQLAISNKWKAPALFDMKGKRLTWPFPFASWDMPDWDGDGKTEIMGGGLVTDRQGRVVGVYEPSWTIPTYCDVTGNGREEVVPWSLDMHGDRIRVFSSAPRPEKRTHKLAIPRRNYNFRD